MIVKNIFLSPCFYEDITFLAAESMQKKTWQLQTSSFAKIGLIQLELSRLFILQCDTIILEYSADILMLEFHAGMS